MWIRHRLGPSASGQASVSLLATLPPLLLCVLAAAQLAIAGHAAWSAGNAARAAARAIYVGGDPEAAARAALPRSLRRGLRVGTGLQEASVRVRVPRLIPLLPRVPLTARSGLAPAGGRDG